MVSVLSKTQEPAQAACENSTKVANLGTRSLRKARISKAESGHYGRA